MSVPCVCDISCGRMHEFALALDRGGFDAQMVQEIINSPDSVMAKKMFMAIRRVTRLYERYKIVVGKTSGTRTIAGSSDVFNGHIDPAFAKLEGDRGPTKEEEAEVYEVRGDATFVQIFDSFGVDHGRLIWNPDQIVEICKSHQDKLRENEGTLFLLLAKTGEAEYGYFVATVHVMDGGLLRAYVERLDYSYVWGRQRLLRVVIPQRSRT